VLTPDRGAYISAVAVAAAGPAGAGSDSAGLVEFEGAVANGAERPSGAAVAAAEHTEQMRAVVAED